MRPGRVLDLRFQAPARADPGDQGIPRPPPPDSEVSSTWGMDRAPTSCQAALVTAASGSEGTVRILVVDDDPDIARFVQSLLERDGSAHVDLASEPFEAFERLEEARYDLIVTGVVMPGMDGYDFVRRLRERPDTSRTPIMFLTARSEPERIAAGYAAGANDYLTKPFDPEELLAHTRALLD